MKNKIINQKYNNTIAIIIIAGLFFIFGFITWVNGVLIPFMRTVNELTQSESYLVASASYISFVVMALPASYLLNKIGYKKGMSIGLIIMAIGAVVFIPAANSRTYWIFLLGIFIQGAGMTILQTAANPYITILGPIESGAKRIAIMGIANKVAGALGSIVFGALLLHGIDEVKDKLAIVGVDEKTQLLEEMANDVITPYIIVALVLFLLGILIKYAPLPDVDLENEDSEKTKKENHTSEKTIFQFPHLWLGVLALFVYVGAEVIAGDTIIAYGISLGIPAKIAKNFTSYTLFAMVFAYILGVILIPKYLTQSKALKISAISGILFTVCILMTKEHISVFFVAALGFSNALVWPAIWPLTLNGLGKHTKTASALLIMAIAGGAILPPLYGKLVDLRKINLISLGINEKVALADAATSSYWILLPCYLIILYYAISGHKLGLNKK